MTIKNFLKALVFAGAVVSSPTARDIDNTQPAGVNVIGAFSVTYVGEQNADNSCSHRDLGFAGSIKDKWYAVYGDTLWCAAGVTDPAKDPSGFHGLVRDSVSALGNNPLVVNDLNLNSDSPVRHQNQFVPFNSQWGETNTFGFGGTSLVETDADSATAAVYYLINDNENYHHAGIGKVQVINGTPTVTQRLGDQGWWWDTQENAKYGDVAAYRDVNSEYIYILGNPPINFDGQFPGGLYVYQARVKATEAFDLTKYDYWWGRQQGWKSDRLTTFTPETAVMWGVGQGQMVYSNYFKTYIYVHLSDSTVTLRTAPNPEGPWSADKDIYQATPYDGGLVYAGVAYPYLDESGKTLTIAYTNSNHIQVIKVTFQ